MQTRKLYYESPMLSQFTARVTDCAPQDGRWAITLDATAFYPEGGGQSWDTGTLGSVRVLETQEQEGRVLHYCDGPLEPGSLVEGRLDWAPRFSRMQNHTGEHMISGTIHRRFGYHNVGFHMGNTSVTMDFDGPVAPEAVAEIEAEVNSLIWQDLPVVCRTPDPKELERLSYRTKRALPWPVRIVEVPGVDRCACCGVHVERTGQVGMVKILSCVKFHQGVRMELVCGETAYRFFSGLLDQTRLVSQAFSAPLLEIGAAARRMNELLSQEKLRCAELERKLLKFQADRFAGREKPVCITENLTPAALRELAEEIARVSRGGCAVFSGEGGDYGYCLACPGGDLRALGKEMNLALRGRGGGKPEFQQGRVSAEKAEIEAFFRSQGWSVE